MNDELRIINCHTHIFSRDHIPSGIYGWLKIMARLFKYRWFSQTLAAVLRLLSRFCCREKAEEFIDRIPHLASFSSFLRKGSQEQIFAQLCRYYSTNNNVSFVVLPMDFTQMGYGQPKVGIEEQHKELAGLRDRVNAQYPDKIIPFVHFDPQGSKPVDLVREYIREHDFRGVKMYPPMGYSPIDPLLDNIYEFCNEYRNGLPIMTHCSIAAVRAIQYDKSEATMLCAPKNYFQILDKYKKLRLCLGHFGGNNGWQDYALKPDEEYRRNDLDQPDKDFLRSIVQVLRSGKYPNLFVDISYVMFQNQENFQLLKELLRDPRIRMQVLFGTDFYMVEIEKFPENKLLDVLRETIGEEYFREIAETNPKRYLFGE